MGPPDFAPPLPQVVSLYDVLFDMAAQHLAIPSDESIYHTGELARLGDLATDLHVDDATATPVQQLSTYRVDFDTATGQPVGAGLPTETDVSVIAFSPDRTTIAASGIDGGIWLWDVASREQLGTGLIGHDVSVDACDFSDDGTRLLSTDIDGTVRVWPIPKPDPEALCAKLTQNMSHQDWDRWVSPDIRHAEPCAGLPGADDRGEK